MSRYITGQPVRHHARSLPERLSEARAGGVNLGRRGAVEGGSWGQPVGHAIGFSVDLGLFLLQLMLWCLLLMLNRGRSPFRLRFPKIGRRIGDRLGRGVGFVGGGLLGGIAGALWAALSGRAPDASPSYQGW